MADKKGSALTLKTNPTDADHIVISDVAAGGFLKRVTKASIIGEYTTFADTTARDAVTTHEKGDFAFITASGETQRYNGATWDVIGGAGQNLFNANLTMATGAKTHELNGQALTIADTIGGGSVTLQAISGGGATYAVSASTSNAALQANGAAGQVGFIEASDSRVNLGYADGTGGDAFVRAQVGTAATTAGKAQLFLTTAAVDAATATVGQVLTLKDAATGEVEFDASAGQNLFTADLTQAAARNHDGNAQTWAATNFGSFQVQAVQGDLLLNANATLSGGTGTVTLNGAGGYVIGDGAGANLPANTGIPAAAQVLQIDPANGNVYRREAVYESTFDAGASWGTAAANAYTYTVFGAIHQRLNPKMVQVWADDGTNYTSRVQEISVNKTTHDVSITVLASPDNRFAGRICIA